MCDDVQIRIFDHTLYSTRYTSRGATLVEIFTPYLAENNKNHPKRWIKNRQVIIHASEYRHGED